MQIIPSFWISAQGVLRAVALLTLSLLIPLHLANFSIPGIHWMMHSASFVLLVDAALRWKQGRESKWSLILQMLAAIPWELAVWPLVMIRVIYLPIWLLQGHVRQHVRSFLQIPFALERAVLSILAILLLTHWVACGWVVLGGGNPNLQGMERYVQAEYWTVVTMASVGYGDITPQTMAQRIYAIFVILMGVGIYGYIIGNVTTMIANLDRAKERHREQMAEMSSWLNFREVPKELRRRVLDHMDLLWQKRLTLDDGLLLQKLPTTLRAEVATHLFRKMLQRVPLLHQAPPAFLAELCTRLRPMVFEPQETICALGQPGEEMFFVDQGEVEVLNPQDSSVIAVLQAGSYFGEIALLAEVPRTATVRTRTLCEMHALRTKDFHAILAHYPEFAQQVRVEAKRRQAELDS